MKNKLYIVNLIALLLVQFTIVTQNSFAQDENLDALVNDTKNDLMLVVGGGLAGAILGLSTLSFVDEPKDHTRNIVVGASIGIIVGVGVVAFSQATKSRDMIYNTGEEPAGASVQSGKHFGTLARNNWHDQVISQQSQMINSPYGVGYSFKF